MVFKRYGLILAAFAQPGDRVLVEQPSYHGALAAIAAAGSRAVPVALNDGGWELDAVHAAIRQLAPVLAYFVPDSHNPTGFTMPEDERKRLGHIISETRAPAPSSTSRSWTCGSTRNRRRRWPQR